jgi:excisionase family DNA binding protein
LTNYCDAQQYNAVASKTIGVKEAAAQLGLTEQRVRALCSQRRIPGARLIGRTWRLPRAFQVSPGERGPAPSYEEK